MDDDDVIFIEETVCYEGRHIQRRPRLDPSICEVDLITKLPSTLLFIAPASIM